MLSEGKEHFDVLWPPGGMRQRTRRAHSHQLVVLKKFNISLSGTEATVLRFNSSTADMNHAFSKVPRLQEFLTSRLWGRICFVCKAVKGIFELKNPVYCFCRHIICRYSHFHGSPAPLLGRLQWPWPRRWRKQRPQMVESTHTVLQWSLFLFAPAGCCDVCKGTLVSFFGRGNVVLQSSLKYQYVLLIKTFESFYRGYGDNLFSFSFKQKHI